MNDIKRLTRLLVIGLSLNLGLSFARAAVVETSIGDHVFSHFDGFEILRVAGPPMIDRPIEISFDERGRLYCTDSAGVNDPVEQQLEEKPHRVIRLEDRDGDGVYDDRIIFAEGMMFPEGCLWHDGSLYVAAPPSIWKLTDTDGDGKADQREEWFQGKTLTGCANDLHGPYLGLDGWIYWTKGAFAEQTYQLDEVDPWVTRAAHIFRANPDGSRMEPVMTGGMDNPVGVTFTPGGERMFTTTFFQHPGGGNRDGLIHAIYGGVYGKDHGVIEGHPRTGDLMPVLTHLGAAAPAGLTRYRSSVFGESFRNNLFSALFNRQLVMRHRLQPKGATFESTDEIFLQSNNRNFHPTDVDEDADGSLLVVDTGGWYKLCCPTSQLPKPDVLGGIYRIRRRDAPTLDLPRGGVGEVASLDWHELVQRLDDPRPAVGDQLIARLGKGGQASLKAMGEIGISHLSSRGRERAVWALSRISLPDARKQTRAFLRDNDSVVRLAAIHSSSLHRDAVVVDALQRILSTDILSNRRAAAEALGRLGESRAIPSILQQLAHDRGRALEHSLIYALIEIGDPGGIAQGLDSVHESVRLGALIALDQLRSSELTGEHLVRALRGEEERTRYRARWILGNRPELGSELLPVLRSWLSESPDAGLPRDELWDVFSKLCVNDTVANLLGDLLVDPQTSVSTKESVLKIMLDSEAEGAVGSWVEGIVSVLQSGNRDLLGVATEAAAHLSNEDADRRPLLKQLMRLSVDDEAGLKNRLIAIGVVAPVLKKLQNDQFDVLLEGIQLEQSVAVRSLAGRALQQAALGNQQLYQLARILGKVGPLEIGACLPPFEKSDLDRVGEALISGLQSSPGLLALTPAMLEKCVAGYSDGIRRGAKALSQRLDVGLDVKQERLAEMLESLPSGDIRRGQAVFNSEKAACYSCHEIGYLGGNVGPDLTRIGRVRSREDLLEAVLFPSMSLVRSYEPFHVMMEDGEQHTGIIRSDNGEAVTLVTGPGQELRLNKNEIFELTRSRVSVMPSGIDEILTPEELGDLLAFLEATRW